MVGTGWVPWVLKVGMVSTFHSTIGLITIDVLSYVTIYTCVDRLTGYLSMSQQKTRRAISRWSTFMLYFLKVISRVLRIIDSEKMSKNFEADIVDETQGYSQHCLVPTCTP